MSESTTSGAMFLSFHFRVCESDLSLFKSVKQIDHTDLSVFESVKQITLTDYSVNIPYALL